MWAPLTSTGLELALAMTADCIGDRLTVWDASAISWSGFGVRVSVRVRVGVWVRVPVAHKYRFGLELALAVADGL